MYDFSTLDLTALTDVVGNVMPVVVPVALGLIGISVAWRITQKFTGRKA